MIGIVRRILDYRLLGTTSKKLTHEAVNTFLAEVCAIVNARPLVLVSTDPEDPIVLSPTTLLTQKYPGNEDGLARDLDINDMYKAQWHHVQLLAEAFWKRWSRDYIHSLQGRRK